MKLRKDIPLWQQLSAVVLLLILGLSVSSNRSYVVIPGGPLQKAYVHHFVSDLAPGDKDTLQMWWSSGKANAETGGFYSLVMVADCTSTDFGNQDSLTFYSKERFYLLDLNKGRARSEVDSDVAKYQVPDNDSTIHATRQSYSLQEPLYYTLLLGVAEGAVIFVSNEATVGDSVRVHTFVYNSK